jgi:hypothetical protein
LDHGLARVVGEALELIRWEREGEREEMPQPGPDKWLKGGKKKEKEKRKKRRYKILVRQASQNNPPMQ